MLPQKRLYGWEKSGMNIESYNQEISFHNQLNITLKIIIFRIIKNCNKSLKSYNFLYNFDKCSEMFKLS